jgi:selenocysteine lyase/cysteine desulfurase
VDALGIDPAEGVLRFSMVHYNTVDEVDRLTAALDAIA